MFIYETILHCGYVRFDVLLLLFTDLRSGSRQRIVSSEYHNLEHLSSRIETSHVMYNTRKLGNWDMAGRFETSHIMYNTRKLGTGTWREGSGHGTGRKLFNCGTRREGS